uniref:Armadillo repeat-containing protein 1 n=2 Tax=Lygus hesperus TaxID=30085 RepID=A0A146LMU9_LYGHE
MSETVSVLQKYKNMVSESIDHHVLLKEKTMIQFLVYILESPNGVEVSLALEVIQLMADNPKNHQQLRSFGLLDALSKLSQSGAEKANAQLASDLLAQLKKPQPPIVRQSAPNHMFPSVVYVLNIPGITNATRRDVEYGVICNRGVISVVVDCSKERCTVRTLSKVTPVDLANSIHSKTGLPVRLVTKNNKGQEMYQDLVILPSERGDEGPIVVEAHDTSQNAPPEDDIDLPEYLPEEDPPVKASAITFLAKFKTGAATVVRSASSFFSDSFYW